ncbi:metal ABC transporter solute-binding protein, Zn/Mn family [Carboxylicivirga linearis]|uniref:Zinc ABC transporter substrate-binding protein n=1 Tax=Carboxylicivirga linearis TaxID=1628157 RepID=A0ABS5JQ61_9BACT|nr:zinc ABC transporter substrate-binding protein [Carboxylicivirga linearis]MBS2096897.1 zinc ABC transporter substrate-binding protein [Carboxylicivirga linearis]
MKFRHLKFFFPILGMIILFACQSGKQHSTKPTVTVSIAPQKFFIEQLTDTLLEVNVMIPAGASHATYSPTPSQLVKLSNSKAYFLMGHLSFENTWKDKLREANKEMIWYNMSEGIAPIQAEHDHHHDEECSHGTDPHTWTSPKEALMIISTLKSALIELFPEYKNTIETNYSSFASEISKMDERLVELQKNNPGLTFMIFHPAYSYLAQAYNFNQMTIEFEGKTPTPARMKQTIEEALDKNISTIYIQQEFDKTNAETIAKAINAQTVQVNPLSENWLDEMNRFITHLEKH